MTNEAFPLDWPPGWPRTVYYHRKRLLPGGGQGWGRVLSRLQNELRLLGATGVVVSTDQPIRLDGAPYAAKRLIDDPGAAVYFTLKGRPLVMAQDVYERLLDNLRSLALAIENLRGLERHGGGVMLDRAFAGFAALPPPDGHGWRDTLDLGADASPDDVRRAYRLKVKAAHPDGGGDGTDVSRLQAARDAGLKELGI